LYELAQVIKGSFSIESGYCGKDLCLSTVALDLNRNDG
jgi:hypothetical protein